MASVQDFSASAALMTATDDPEQLRALVGTPPTPEAQASLPAHDYREGCLEAYDADKVFENFNDGEVHHWCPITGTHLPASELECVRIYPYYISRSPSETPSNHLPMPHVVAEAFRNHQIVIIPRPFVTNKKRGLFMDNQCFEYDKSLWMIRVVDPSAAPLEEPWSSFYSLRPHFGRGWFHPLDRLELAFADSDNSGDHHSHDGGSSSSSPSDDQHEDEEELSTHQSAEFLYHHFIVSLLIQAKKEAKDGRSPIKYLHRAMGDMDWYNFRRPLRAGFPTSLATWILGPRIFGTREAVVALRLVLGDKKNDSDEELAQIVESAKDDCEDLKEWGLVADEEDEEIRKDEKEEKGTDEEMMEIDEEEGKGTDEEEEKETDEEKDDSHKLVTRRSRQTKPSRRFTPY